MKIDETIYQDLTTTFKHLAPIHAKRWSYLLAHSEKRWRKISPFDVWPSTDTYGEWPTKGLPELVQQMLGSPMATQLVTVLDTFAGHAYRDQLNNVLSIHPLTIKSSGYRIETVLTEGFLSIVPGRLAYLCNHEGGQALWGWEYLAQYCSTSHAERRQK